MASSEGIGGGWHRGAGAQLSTSRHPGKEGLGLGLGQK
jgi:hypothetical protein